MISNIDVLVRYFKEYGLKYKIVITEEKITISLKKKGQEDFYAEVTRFDYQDLYDFMQEFRVLVGLIKKEEK